MQQFENAANSQDGMGLVQGYHQALDALQAARSDYSGERLSRVEADQMGRTTQPDVNDSQAEQAPAGYEEMTGAYFRSLSDSSNQSGASGTPATDATPATGDQGTTAAPTATPAPAANGTTPPASSTPAAAAPTPTSATAPAPSATPAVPAPATTTPPAPTP
jgi:hypothetical protein